MGHFIDRFGEYHEGDMQPGDIEVLPRPGPNFNWNPTKRDWEELGDQKVSLTRELAQEKLLEILCATLVKTGDLNIEDVPQDVRDILGLG